MALKNNKLALAALTGLMTAGTLSGCQSMEDKKESNACKTDTQKEANTCSANDAHSCAGRNQNSCK